MFAIAAIVFGVMALVPNGPIQSPAQRRVVQANTDEDITKVARAFSAQVVKFSWRRPDVAIADLLKYTTPGFKTSYHSAFRGDINVYRAEMVKNRAISDGDAKGVTVTSQDEDTATALVIVSQTITDAHKGKRFRYRVYELTLVKGATGWKVDNVSNPSKPKNG